MENSEMRLGENCYVKLGVNPIFPRETEELRKHIEDFGVPYVEKDSNIPFISICDSWKQSRFTYYGFEARLPELRRHLTRIMDGRIPNFPKAKMCVLP